MDAHRFTLRLLLFTFASVLSLQIVYSRWPKAVCSDATYSVFAAQNAAERGRFETVEPNLHFDADLAKIKLQWLNSWPPLVSLAYAAFLKAGFTPGGATDWLVFGLLLAGCCGWVLCLREAGMKPAALYALSFLIPWTSFPLLGMNSFYNDHFAWALAPWAMLLLLWYPDQKKASACDFWFRLPLTALLCGIPVAAKYSALPVVAGFGLFFWSRNNCAPAVRKALHLAWFTFFLLVPGGVVYFLNRLLSGQATAQVHGNVPLFPIGPQQMWNLAILPLKELTGWGSIAFHLHSALPVNALASCLVLAIWICLGFVLYNRRRDVGQKPFFRLLLILTGALWVFLLSVTVLLGYQCDWTTQARYSFPVIFGWFCLALGLMFDPETGTISRTVLAATCGIPILATLAAGATKPFFRPSPVPLPESRLAASSAEASAYRVLHQKLDAAESPRPALIIAETPQPMNELRIPTICWYYLEGFKRLDCSNPTTVWSLLNESDSQLLRTHLDKAQCAVTQINLPAECPWTFLVLDFR